MASNTEIAKILAALASGYPRYELTEPTVAFYVDCLADIDGQALAAAAKECAGRLDFFPSVHELRQAVNDHQRLAAGIPNAYQAWAEVSTASPEYGEVSEEDGRFYISHRPHAWSHPIVERVARLLGWPQAFPGDNPGVDRAHFFKAYETTLAETMANNMRMPDVAAYIEGARSGAMRIGDGLK